MRPHAHVVPHIQIRRVMTEQTQEPLYRVAFFDGGGRCVGITEATSNKEFANIIARDYNRKQRDAARRKERDA